MGFVFDPDKTTLVKAKQCFREALKGSEFLDPTLLAQLHVNYGNCLSGLGRSLEALSEYDAALRYDPGHPMAWGNLGVELEYFAYIGKQSSLLKDASEALERALSGALLEELGQSAARTDFENARRRIQGRLERYVQNSSTLESEPPMSEEPSLQSYIQFCAKHQLFLNFCLKNRPCKNVAQDSVRFSLVTNINDETSFPRLARVVNEIKERYALARLLLYEACYPLLDTRPYDQITYYVDNLDYAVYGVRVAKLKVAFESAYNILDKIAFFVNDCLRLGMREPDVNFGSIWRNSKGAPIRRRIVELQNQHLFGLCDISSDLAPEGYLSHLRQLRNCLTHRYLVPHVEAITWLTDADAPQYHLGYREFLDRAIELMQLVRSALIYLVAFIDREERVKYEKTRKLIPSLQVQAYRHDSPGPQDSTV